MRHWLASAVFLLAFTSAGWAQTVTVRGGEHADFTRIVFNVPERMDVALRYQQAGIELRFDQDPLSFDTSTVFDVIPTTRLRAVDVATGSGDDAGSDTGLSRVALTLNCRCDVRTFWAGDSAFVVDIGDETAVSAALFTTLQDTPSSAPELQPSARAPVTETGILRPAQEPPKTPVQNVQSDPGATSVGSAAFLIAETLRRQQDLRQAPRSELSEYADRVRDSQDAIVEQIGRAATQGLLSPREDLMPQVPQTLVETAPVQTPQPVADQAPDMQGTSPRNLILSAQTSVDQALAGRINLAAGQTDTSGCLNPERVDVSRWAGEDRFIDQIGAFRSGLIGEFDAPSETAIRSLARFYIHFGFGAEANQVLGMLPVDTTPDPVLPAMVHILEHGDAGPNSVLAGYMDCEPIVAVWSLLSYDEVPGNQPIDPDAILMGMMSLPVPLRAHLGPIVGQKLRVAGYKRAADHVARTLLRSDETMSAEADFLNATTSGSKPDARPSEEELGAVVAGNAQPSAQALIQLIDAHLTDADPISEDIALLAGAYAQEYRDVDLGRDLARAYVLSLASSGGFDEAMSELDRLTQANPVPRDSTLSDLITILTDKADGPTFLTHTVNGNPSMRFFLDDEVGNQVAIRLMALGFPNEASQFVAPMARGEAERERKLLRAEIALRNDNPRQAELELLGEAGEDVLDILARARSMSGEHGAAQDIYKRLDARNDVLREALLDGDWETLQTHSDPAISAIATRQTVPDTPEEDNVTEVLARNTSMIEDSQSMRAEIEALLSGMTIPATLPETDP